LLLLVSQFSKV